MINWLPKNILTSQPGVVLVYGNIISRNGESQVGMDVLLLDAIHVREVHDNIDIQIAVVGACQN